jgi:hypothetical protein
MGAKTIQKKKRKGYVCETGRGGGLKKNLKPRRKKVGSGYLEEFVFENFKIFENNLISVELAKVLG